MCDLARAREEIPLLVEELRDVNPEGADWVEDVFSEVLRQLRRGNVRDPQMVEWLYESITYHTTRGRSGVHEPRRSKGTGTDPLPTV